MTTQELPLSVEDRAEIQEMITNCKLLAIKLSGYHMRNKHLQTGISASCANQAKQLQNMSHLLRTISNYHS